MVTTFPGVGLANYKSFGSEMQLVAELDRINVFIGPNNSGKSTTLGFFAIHLEPIWSAIDGSTFELAPEYQRRVIGEVEARLRVTWPIRPNIGEETPITSRGMATLLEFLTRSDCSGWPIYE